MATLIKRAESVHKQGCAAALQRTDCGQAVEAVTCCIQVPVPDSLAVTLEPLARIYVDRMLVDRKRCSSAFYPEVPCVIAKSLIAKYQRNKKHQYENHKVSKQIVDYAVKHRRAIVLEKLEKVRRGRMRHYVEKSQWSFYQLFQFILYKAALHGVMVMEADPAYTSQECSRCHQISKPNGKSFRCGSCGHHDHRDANAAFTLAERVMPIGGVATDSARRGRGLLVVPFLGTEVQQCA